MNKCSSALQCFFTEQALGIDDTFIVGVSGGADSMALAHSLALMGCKNIIIAHVNHQLRGEESQQDAEFVKQFCSQYQWKFEYISYDVSSLAQKEKESIETTARSLRMGYFHSLMDEYGASGILLGHHEDDQVETILFRLFRGSKFTGLQGIQSFDPPYLRPFLSISKKDILTCCQEHHWRYRNDSSNFENEYTRNKIRNLLIPLLHEVHPGSKRSILQLGQDCQEIQQYLTLQARDFLGTTQEFQKNDFIKLPTILQKEVLAELYNRANQGPMGLHAALIDEMIKFVHGSNSHAKKAFQNLVLERRGKTLFIFESEQSAAEL